MNDLKLFVSALFFVGLINPANSANCPLDNGENSNPCQNEQEDVDQALEKYTKAIQYSYCRVPLLHIKNGVGLQCRTLTHYKDEKGEITKDFFKFQFVAYETRRTVATDTYYVKQDDGSYNSYHDEVADNKVIIDVQLQSWRGVSVDFDGNFPSYETVFTFSQGPGKPKLEKVSRVTFRKDMVNLQVGTNLPLEEQESWVYPLLGAPQTPKK